jgi:hypothetical protein
MYFGTQGLKGVASDETRVSHRVVRCVREKGGRTHAAVENPDRSSTANDSPFPV